LEVTIDTTQPQEINWGANGVARVAQNVLNLISTRRYEVAYDRLMGLDPDLIHKPVDQLIALATSEIIDLISTREPRATIKTVEVLGVDSNGDIQAKVVIEIG
jgi:hypothetical protein